MVIVMNVHWGCGLCAPESWVNFDCSLTIALQRVPVFGRVFKQNPFPRFPSNVKRGNIVRGLPLSSACADLVYCSHALEHLALDEFRMALKETYRLLKAGGYFRLVVPDLQRIAKEYLESESDRASHGFMKSSDLGLEKKDRRFRGRVRAALGASQHLWMWDYKSMRYELERAGFCEIRRASFGDSGIAAFEDVEAEDRWKHELGVQCRK